MNSIIDYYSVNDEWGRLDREPLEFTINMHHIMNHLLKGARILDNGAGPGKYTFHLANQGHRVTLSDVTPRLVELAKAKAEVEKPLVPIEGFHVLDATNLSIFPDNHFDAVLMMGPMYHLQDENQRNQGLRELYRVTKPGGTVFVAFMTRTRFLTTALMNPEGWRPAHTAQGIEDFMETGHFNHDDPGRFTGAYYFNIDAIKPLMAAAGFEAIKLIGSRSVAGAMTKEQWAYWQNRGDAEVERIMRLIIKESENPYVLGISSHLLYIGRK